MRGRGGGGLSSVVAFVNSAAVDLGATAAVDPGSRSTGPERVRYNSAAVLRAWYSLVIYTGRGLRNVKTSFVKKKKTSLSQLCC